MSGEQNSDVQPGRLARFFARLGQGGRLPLDEAAARAADYLEGVDQQGRRLQVRRRGWRLSWEEAADRAAADLEGR
ncbi:hypothetical protein ACWD26_29765 [Streptomyces sp. NPDC002787]